MGGLFGILATLLFFLLFIFLMVAQITGVIVVGKWSLTKVGILKE